jgi:hypothetical protein
MGNNVGAKSVFNRSLLSCLNIDLWKTYLQFIKQASAD